MEYIRIDRNAYAILNEMAERMKTYGIEKTSFLEIIRWMYGKIKELDTICGCTLVVWTRLSLVSVWL